MITNIFFFENKQNKNKNIENKNENKPELMESREVRVEAVEAESREKVEEEGKVWASLPEGGASGGGADWKCLLRILTAE